MVRVPFTVRHVCLPCSTTGVPLSDSLKLCCFKALLRGHLQLYIYVYISLKFARLSSRGTTDLLTSLREEIRAINCKLLINKAFFYRKSYIFRIEPDMLLEIFFSYKLLTRCV